MSEEDLNRRPPGAWPLASKRRRANEDNEGGKKYSKRRRLFDRNKPLPCPECHTDAIVQAFGLDALAKHGYINYIGEQLPAFHSLETMPIHPIFRRDNFFVGPFGDPRVDLQVEVPFGNKSYDVLSPALKIASGILSEPSLQPFLAGILARHLWTQVTEWPNTFQPRDTMYSFKERDGQHGDPSSHETWRQVAELQHCLKFRFKECDKGTLMETEPDLRGRAHTRFGLVPQTTFPTIINVNIEWYSELLMDQDAKMYTLDRVKGYDRQAHFHRMHFFLASVFVHEISHALFYASKEWRANAVVTTFPPEPLYRDSYIPELGYATEQVLFDGVMSCNTKDYRDQDQTAYLSAPYGLQLVRFPGGIDVSGAYSPMGSPAQYGRTSAVYYAVPMRYMHQFFTEDFWQKKVKASGMQAFKPLRYHGFRYGVRSLRPGETLFRDTEPESPSPPASTMTREPPADREAHEQELKDAKRLGNRVKALMGSVLRSRDRAHQK